MKNAKRNKIIFIVLVSVFTTLWVASLVMLGFASYSESITNSIETWYSNTFKEKTLDLFKTSMWATVINTFALLMTLLAKEFKKKYLDK